MEDVFKTLLSIPNLAKDQEEWIEEMKNKFERDKNDKELNATRESLLEHFRYERSLRQVFVRKPARNVPPHRRSGGFEAGWPLGVEQLD